MVRLELPWDLVEEILYRVPVTSLRRLRFTCKRWNSLFKYPDFIKKNLDKAAKQNSVLMLRNFGVYSLSVDHNPSIEFTSKLRRSLNESEQVEITQVFHCNGLLLCSTREANKNKLMIVNPCTGQTRWIEPRSVYHMDDRYALGYENNNNKSYESYKILRFPYAPYACNQFEIFELKSNSWRVLANIPPQVVPNPYQRGMSLKGTTYWISCSKDILSFDFRTEQFIRLCFPFQKLGYYNIALSVFREEQLSLLKRDYDTQQMEIWVSNKTDTETVVSWSNSLTLDLRSQFDHTLNFYLSFLFDEEKKVVVACGRSVRNYNKDMIYIVGKHGRREFDNDTDQYSNHCLPYLFSYVPSLVSLNPPM